jgi:hypothetical protein
MKRLLIEHELAATATNDKKNMKPAPERIALHPLLLTGPEPV